MPLMSERADINYNNLGTVNLDKHISNRPC